MTSFKALLDENRVRHAGKRRIANRIMLSTTAVFTAIALVPLFWIVFYVFVRGGKTINLDFFTQLPKPLGMAGGGVLHAIEGTLVLTVIAGVIAIPFGVFAAFYASRYPNTLLGVGLRFSTDVLSGIPSIIVGLFIYAGMVKPMGHYSAIAGGAALSVLMLPTIIRTTEEMLKLVPGSLREGSLALGAPEWKTSVSVLFPAALNGIITGFLLAVARAAGETAPLLFTALGNEHYNLSSIVSSGVKSHQNLFQIINRMVNQPVDSLPLTLWKYSQQPYPERIDQSWGVALVLMLLVLMINISVRVWIQARTKRMKG